MTRRPEIVAIRTGPLLLGKETPGLYITAKDVQAFAQALKNGQGRDLIGLLDSYNQEEPQDILDLLLDSFSEQTKALIAELTKPSQGDGP